MLKSIVKAALISLPLTLVSAQCGNHYLPSPTPLRPGGVLVTDVQGGGCEGCEALNQGDLIQQVDGETVETRADLEAAGLSDGKDHELVYLQHSSGEVKTIRISASPDNSMAPVKRAPPFSSVGAAQLDKTERWARRRLFGHASPQMLLISVDGGFINGRDLYGKKHLMVFFDWSTSSDRQDGATMLKVLQKAQYDLKTQAGVEIIFAQIKHPSERERPPMDDTDLRVFSDHHQVGPAEGGPLPLPPLYRMPSSSESDPAQLLGLEGAFTYAEALGEAPNIVVLDEKGVIRWHSAGKVPDPEGRIADDMVYMINAAVLFALRDL